MKRKETKIIEQVLYGNLFGTNPKLAKEYGTEEVPIGFARGGRINNKIEIVDFLSYDMKKDWFRCYEIKVSMSDFKSKAAKSWQGNYNYLVLSEELYHQRPLDWWKNNVPKYVGIMVVNTASRFHFVAKRPVFQQITEERKDVLKKSLLRTLFYQKEKICETKEELGFDSTEMEV